MANKARVALIGVGNMAALHAQAVRHAEGIEFVSCASRTRARAEKFAREHGIPHARTVDEVLASPQADALWVVAPAEIMADLAIEYARLGLPLFLEKPVGYSVEETRRVAQAVDVPHMVGLNRRFYGIFEQGRELLDKAGGVRAVEVHVTEYPAAFVDHYPEKVLHGWHYGNSVHMIDLFRFFGGEVRGIVSCNDVRDMQDRSYMSLLTFESGAKGVYNAQWYAAAGWRLSVYADDLSIQYQPVESAVIYRRDGREEMPVPERDTVCKAGLVGQAEAFGRLVSRGEMDERAADLQDYLKTQELIERLSDARANACAGS